MEMLSRCWTSLKLYHSVPSERLREIWGEERGTQQEGERERISFRSRWIPPWYRLSKWFRRLNQQPHYRDHSVRQQHKAYCHVFTCFVSKPIQIFLIVCLFMHQNGLPQWVSQLALQARVRARAWRKEGMGTSPWRPSPQTKKWKQVCLCGNAAVMLLDTQQAAVTLPGRFPQRPGLGIINKELHVME